MYSSLQCLFLSIYFYILLSFTADSDVLVILYIVFLLNLMLMEQMQF